MAQQVFGTILAKIGERRDFPAIVVRVHVPKEAQALLHRPFELAHLDAKELTYNVDSNSAQIIRRILELIEQPTPEEVE
jgi:hypothetical protein